MMTNQKPIDYDFHFKYECPNSDCSLHHWLSFLEAKTPQFIVVCDCDTIFSIEPINSIEISYAPTTEPVVSSLENDCIEALGKYGFSTEESKQIFSKAIIKFPTTDLTSLIRYILQHFGELNECY